MLVVSCIRCSGWVAMLANENDASLFALACKEERLKPDRKLTVSQDPYVEREWRATGMCRASARNEQCFGPEFP